MVRKTLDQIMSEPADIDRAKMDATTEDDIRRHMIEDGQDPDEDLSKAVIVSPRVIRQRLGMSQSVFARTLHIPIATLRNWEQNRVAMDPAVLSLMIILAREPEAALRALTAA